MGPAPEDAGYGWYGGRFGDAPKYASMGPAPEDAGYDTYNSWSFAWGPFASMGPAPEDAGYEEEPEGESNAQKVGFNGSGA